MFSDPAVLRVVAAVAAATAVVGAAVLRRWDTYAGKQVADLTRARASDEWRFEERVAELETDLDESRELRGKLEKRLRAKRTELAGLRNEHAALLRRYATAETERASALEGRRLLEMESTADPEPHALPAAGAEEESRTETGVSGTPESAETPEAVGTRAPAAFSPEGAQLYARARSALAKLDPEAAAAASGAGEPVKVASGKAGGEDSAQEDEAEGQLEAADEHTRAVAPHPADGTDEAATAEDTPGRTAAAEPAAAERPAPTGAGRAVSGGGSVAATGGSGRAASGRTGSTGVGSTASVSGTVAAEPAAAESVTGRSVAAPAAAGRAATQPAGSTASGSGTVAAEPAAAGTGAAGGASALSAALVPRPAAPVVRPAGHFTVPTAVAVVPAAQPVRRPTAEGGFDFFGTKSATPDALDAVQNEDLADVVGQEALALHKAEAEAEFKPAGEEARGVGQVIDLTAHDETEVIDLQSLRSAVS
ncbi:hypothetical protein U5640_19455 [Streptomyces sp. SS7]|uniref:hypothetical protein n=1 Tax=Streptomyces sp. SS7 TaxID=3108485 RepID=UPI0030EB5227